MNIFEYFVKADPYMAALQLIQESNWRSLEPFLDEICNILPDHQLVFCQVSTRDRQNHHALFLKEREVSRRWGGVGDRLILNLCGDASANCGHCLTPRRAVDVSVERKITEMLLPVFPGIAVSASFYKSHYVIELHDPT